MPVPPPGYGGTEEVIDNLACGPTALGHDVLLFTVGAFTCPGGGRSAGVPQRGTDEAGVDGEPDAGDEHACFDVAHLEADKQSAVGRDGARCDGQAKHEQGADDLGGARDGVGEREQEHQAEAAGPVPAASAVSGVDRREQ